MWLPYVIRKVLKGLMEAHQVQDNELHPEAGFARSTSNSQGEPISVSIETEIPEVLYQGMKDFIGSNPKWDQYKVMKSALANFLFQNGCDDRAVTETYLNGLFSRPDV